MNFCKDCRWAKPFIYSKGYDYSLAKCLHPESGKLNLATGTQEYDFCDIQRGQPSPWLYRSAEKCGPEGARFWARTYPDPPLPFLTRWFGLVRE